MTARPDMRTMLLGSRFTAPLIMAGCTYVTYRWWEGGGHGIIGLIAIGLFIASAKAMNSVAVYRRWRADWDGMSLQGQTKDRKAHSRGIAIAKLLAGAVVTLVAMFACLGTPPFELGGWQLLTAEGGGALAFALILGRLICLVWPPRRRRQQPTQLVSVAIERPVRPVTTIRDAYKRLPGYCLQLLKGQAS